MDYDAAVVMQERLTEGGPLSRRPSLAGADVAEAKASVGAGSSVAEVARRFGVTPRTLKRTITRSQTPTGSADRGLH